MGGEGSADTQVWKVHRQYPRPIGIPPQIAPVLHRVLAGCDEAPKLGIDQGGYYYDVAPVTCDLRPVTCDLRPVTCDLGLARIESDQKLQVGVSMADLRTVLDAVVTKIEQRLGTKGPVLGGCSYQPNCTASLHWTNQ